MVKVCFNFELELLSFSLSDPFKFLSYHSFTCCYTVWLHLASVLWHFLTSSLSSITGLRMPNTSRAWKKDGNLNYYSPYWLEGTLHVFSIGRAFLAKPDWALLSPKDIGNTLQLIISVQWLSELILASWFHVTVNILLVVTLLSVLDFMSAKTCLYIFILY